VNGALEAENKRDQAGRFLPGCKGGPGRPKGSFDLLALSRKRARAEGIDLRERLWSIVKTLFDLAEGGDVVAARLLLDRFCTPVDQPLSLHVQQGIAIAGPPAPETAADLRGYLARLAEVAADLDKPQQPREELPPLGSVPPIPPPRVEPEPVLPEMNGTPRRTAPSLGRRERWSP
jgi:hypothetical protein